MKYQCAVCGYIYDEKREGVSFDKLPSNWRCPRCGAPKSAFKPVEEKTQDNPATGGR